ncbi:MAG: NUDIX domain-containing protein [Burkholderiales bacterium]|jgi:ADP-ribose pyrophosphatase
MPHNDDSHLMEFLIRSESVYSGTFLQIQRDEVCLPDGRIGIREYIVHPGGVMIVPILDDGRLVIERQFRYPLQRVMIEFPAGKLDPHESALACAQRELLEETGYRAGQWARAGILHNAIAYSDEGIEVWFAQGLRAGPSQLDQGEFLEVATASIDELESYAAQGLLTDAKTLIGLLWLRHWRDGRWPLSWTSTLN